MNTLDFLSRNRKISRWFIISIISMLPMLSEIQGALGLISLIIFSLAMICVFYHSLILFKSLPQDFSKLTLILGISLILGGALFDIGVTLFYSPDLQREGNPIILTLLSLDFSLWSIYLISLLHQICMLGSVILLWGVFLKNYPNIIKLIPCKSFFTTFKWLLGCGQMSFSDFILNRNSNPYFFTLFFILAIVISHLSRWYFAMEWLQVVPRSNMIPIVIILTALFLSVIKIHSALKSQKY